MIFFARFTADLEYREGEPALYVRMTNGVRGRLWTMVTLKAPLDVVFEGRTYVFEERPAPLTVEDIHHLVLEARRKDEENEPQQTEDAIRHPVRIPATPA